MTRTVFVPGEVSVRGTNLVLSERTFAELKKGLPKRGIALWEFELDGTVVSVPVSRRWVRAYRVGDGTVVVVPQGTYVTIWRAVLGRGKTADDLVALLRQTFVAKQFRQLEIAGVYGPGGSLPLTSWRSGDEDYPQFDRGTPVGRYVRAMESAFGVKPIVSEVGIAMSAALRIAERLGLPLDDPARAVMMVGEAARAGRLLLVLRRMPLTDPMTGFVVALPVIIDGGGVGSGEMVWLPPDVALALYGDEDGDRYYVDIAAAVGTEGWSGLLSEFSGLLIRPLEAFWTGSVSAPCYLADFPVKMSGLHGAAALAGVLATQGVGPLFAIVYRVAGALDRAGYRNESLLVSSYLMRVLEPLFDARKRLVSGGIAGTDPVTGESVPAFSLPYTRAIVQAVRCSTVRSVRDVFRWLADALLADADEDARAVGELVDSAVGVLDSVLVKGDIPFALSDSDVTNVTLRDIDLFAATSALAPLDGSLVRPVARPVLPEVRRGGSGSSDDSLPGWLKLESRELRHYVGGQSYVGVGLTVAFDHPGDTGVGVLHRRVARALGHLADDLAVLVSLPLVQVAPRSERLRARFEEGDYTVIYDEDSLSSFVGEVLLNGVDDDTMAIVDTVGNVLHPVLWADGEVVSVYADVPVRVEDGVVVGDLSGKMSPDAVVSDRRLFKLGLGRVERDGVVWYRWHLLMLVADKRRGLSWSGTPFTTQNYAIVSVYATPWFDADPESLVSGCHILTGFGDRMEWLPGRFDAVVTSLERGVLRVESLYLTPPVQLLSALLAGVLFHELGVIGSPTKNMAPAVRAVLFGSDAVAEHPYGADEAVRVQRAVRQLVRRVASQSLVLRHEFSEPTARHITVFGDLLRDGLVYAGSDPEPDVALHRFDRLVSSVLHRLYGAVRWYPRKGGQNRIIALDIANREHWDDLLAFGGQEWYRFVRETPGLMSVSSCVHRMEGVVHPLLVALVDAPGMVQPLDGSSSSETAYISADAIDWVEQERSQLVALPPDVDVDTLLRRQLEDLKRHGFLHLRGVSGLVSVDDVLSQPVINFDKLGVAYRIYEASVTSDVMERSLQFWAVSRTRPAGAKVVLLDGMIKSFATVVGDRIELEDGTPVDAVFSAISAKKKQAWGLFLNGAARMHGIDVAPIWEAYVSVLESRAAEYTVTTASEIETAAMRAAFAKAAELGVPFESVELFVVRGGKRVPLGTAFVGIVYAVFIDDTALRDDDPYDAGFNGTVLFSGLQVGVPYQRRFVDAARAVELSQSIWHVIGSGVGYESDAPVFRIVPDDDDDPGTDDPTGSDDPGDGPVTPDGCLEIELGVYEMSDEDLAELGIDVGSAVSVGGLGDLDLLISSDVAQEPCVVSSEGSSVPAPMCVIVGTRDPSEEQREACISAVRAAVERGLVVLSGGADGIDRLAVSTAVECGGSAVTILPCSQSVELPGVVEVQPPLTDDAVDFVRAHHPNPDALTDGVLALHVRNLRMLERLLEVRRAREAAGESVKDCIVLALPRYRGGIPAGGTAMAIRLAEALGLPCRVYEPGEGWA